MEGPAQHDEHEAATVAEESGGIVWGRVGFLGPPGTFTEEALLAAPGLVATDLVPLSTINEALRAAESGEVAAAFVPIENSIEGTVSATLDHLVFDSDLLIQAEAVLDVHLHLLALPGTRLEEVDKVISFPHASAQCRRYLHEVLGGVEVLASNSTAEAARKVGEEKIGGMAAIAPMLAGRLYGLEPVAEQIEDFSDNQTRFLLVAAERVPPPSGHDRTTIVCFQRTDHPGSLHEILGQFAARNLNLTKIESRPTKQSLGDYCFVIDLEGHVADEVVGDCLKELHVSVGGLKFLGSYPTAGDHASRMRGEISERRREADSWLADVRSLMGPQQPTE